MEPEQTMEQRLRAVTHQNCKRGPWGQRGLVAGPDSVCPPAGTRALAASESNPSSHALC